MIWARFKATGSDYLAVTESNMISSVCQSILISNVSLGLLLSLVQGFSSALHRVLPAAVRSLFLSMPMF